MKFNEIKITDESNVPLPRQNRIDYTPLITQAKLLTQGKVLKIPIEKAYQVTPIRTALTKFEKNRKYRVYRTTKEKQLYAIVKLAEGYE